MSTDHPSTAVTSPAVDGQPIDYACGNCGATLNARTYGRHRDWHNSMRKVAVALAELAGVPSTERP